MEAQKALNLRRRRERQKRERGSKAVSKDKVSRHEVHLQFVGTSLAGDKEEFRWHLPFRADIKLMEGAEEESDRTVGYVQGWVILGAESPSEEELIDSADAIDDDVLAVTKSFFHEDGENTYLLEDRYLVTEVNLLYVSHIYVDEKYQGRGIGGIALDVFTRHVGYGCNATVLLPRPLKKMPGGGCEVQHDPELEKRLKAFYTKLGFHADFERYLFRQHFDPICDDDDEKLN